MYHLLFVRSDFTEQSVQERIIARAAAELQPRPFGRTVCHNLELVKMQAGLIDSRCDRYITDSEQAGESD